MNNREPETPRSPIAVEPLESRVCLSSSIGGDFAHHLGDVAAADGRVRGGGERHAGMHRGGLARPAAMQMDGPRGASQTNGERMSNHLDVPQGRRAVIAMPGMLLILDFPVTFNPPGLDGPAVSDDVGDVVTPRGVTYGGGKITTTVARANTAELVQAPADALVAAETAAAETNVTVVEDAVAATGPMLASATAPTSVARALASSASAVIDRLTSPWHDGSVAGAVEFAADAMVTEWLPAAAQTFVATAVDAASNLLAPLAGGEDLAPLAAAFAPAVANVAAYEIAHMGSPFALLADSVATFVEESATVTNVVARASSRGPWALTAGVIAADVVILTYVYRRKSTRRAQLAPVGVA